MNVIDRFLVVLDANALYPPRTMDALLSFAEAGLYRPRFTEDILDEWMHARIRHWPEGEDRIRRTRAVICEKFDECLVTGYAPLVETLQLPDPRDRHVLAAAIRCSAQHIVTENHRDFPDAALAPFDLSTIGADEFLANTFELHRPDATKALKQMRRRYVRPTMNASEFLLSLTRSGMPTLAARAREVVEFL